MFSIFFLFLLFWILVAIGMYLYFLVQRINELEMLYYDLARDIHLETEYYKTIDLDK